VQRRTWRADTLPSPEHGERHGQCDISPMDCCAWGAHNDAPVPRQQRGVVRQHLCSPKSTQTEEKGTALQGGQRALRIGSARAGKAPLPKFLMTSSEETTCPRTLAAGIQSPPCSLGSTLVLRALTKRRKQDPTHFYSSAAGRRTPSIQAPLVRSLWKRQKDVRLSAPPSTLLLLAAKDGTTSVKRPCSWETAQEGRQQALSRTPSRDPSIHYLWALFPFSLSFTFPDGSPDLSSIAQLWPGGFSRGCSEEPFSAGKSPTEPPLARRRPAFSSNI